MDRPSKAYCEHLLGPITALAFAKDFLFAGEGPYLKLSLVSGLGEIADETYEVPYSKALATWRIFDTQAIHGIVVTHDNDQLVSLLIYGGRCVRAAAIPIGPSTGEAICLGKVQICSDWILDLALRPQPDDIEPGILEAVAVTAHNAMIGLVVPMWTLSGDSRNDSSDVKQEALTGATKCMLYAASIRWLNPRMALVVSGTAFGEIIVWTCQIERLSAMGINRLQVHYAFPAHDGSIFGLDTYFSTHQSDDRPSRALVASCSDDRTIRVWDMSAAISNSATNFSGNDTIVERDVSEFVAGHVTPGTKELLKPAPVCFLKIWAHNSRIWHVKFAPSLESSSNASNITVFSFGEDATAQAWNLELLNDHSLYGTARFENIGIFSGHSGKNLWSYALTEESPGKFLVATGGADGRIVVGEVPNIRIAHSGSDVEYWTIEELTKNIERPSGLLTDSEDIPSTSRLKEGLKTYSFIGVDTIIATTQRGMVIRIAFGKNSLLADVHKTCTASYLDPALGSSADADQDGDGMETHLICHNQSLASYSVIAGLPSREVAFIGGADGQVLFYDDHSRTLKTWTHLRSKIAGLFVSQSLHQSDHTVFLLATEVAGSSATLFALPEKLGSVDNMAQSPAIKLSLPDGSVITSMAYSGSALHSIIVGSRDGRIFLYPLTGPGSGHESPSDVSEPAINKTVQQVGRHLDAVTSILVQDIPHQSRCHVLTTARDSTYAIHKISTTPLSFSSVKVHDSNLPFGPNIEGVYHSKSIRGLRFFGFHSKDFVDYSETDLAEVSRVECGGAHRVWTYQPKRPGENSCGRVLWTKAAKLHSFSQREPKRKVLKRGGHGREIKACALRPRACLPNNRNGIFATGAEDTDIRLFQYVHDEYARTVKCVSVLKKHNTGIQQLQWSDNGQYLFSCGGCEELFVWRIKDDASQTGFVDTHVVCEAILPPASELPDLRIMSISIQQHQRAATGQEETQIWFSVFMVYSDSTMRTYSYTPYLATFSLVGTGIYKTCCLTQAHYLDSESPFAITGATDGTISIWNTQEDNETISCLLSTRAHQNAVKDLAHVNVQLSDIYNTNEHLIFSVGDDNAIAATRLKISSEEPYNVSTASLIIPRAHVAAATAISIIKTYRTGERVVVRLATSGNDQRLKSWEFSCDLTRPGVDGIDVRKLSNEAVAVADVSCMASFEAAPNLESETRSSNEIIICGVGMQVFKIE